MAWQDCANEIRNATGIDLSDEQIMDMYDDLLMRKKAAQEKFGLGDGEALDKAAKDAADDAEAAAMIQKRNTLLNLRARISRRARISSAPDPTLGVHAEIRSINTPIHGSRFSAEAEWKALDALYNGGFVSELDKAGLFSAAKDRTLGREWAKELFELSKGEDGQPGVTGSKPALDIANVIKRYQDLAKYHLNQAGATIGDYAGYITRTSHNADKIRRAGYDAWRADVEPALAPETLNGVDDPEKFFKGIYNALVTGVHMVHGGDTDWHDPAFTGPGNLAKRISQGRVLHFKDADSWLDYNAKYGNPNLLETISHNFRQAARSTALMRRWGTNPRAEFEQDLRYFSDVTRDKNPETAVKFRQSENNLKNEFGYLDGTNDQPVNRLGARIGAGARAVATMAHLGTVALTHLSSLVSKAAELHYHGAGLLESYGDSMLSMFRARGKGETREVMDLLHAGLQGMQHDIITRFEPDDTIPGTLSKLSNIYFKLNGLTYFVNAQKAGAEYFMSRRLGTMLGTAHADLEPEVQRLLDLYRITPAEWDAVRNAPDHTKLNGKRFLTPDAAMRIEGLPKRAQEDLGIKLHALFNDIAERAIITPGIAEKALMLHGTRPGSLAGEAWRFIAQFKTWPAAAVRQGLGREVYGGQGKATAVAGVMHMAVMSAVIGYLAMTAKDFLKGQNPRAPNEPATWGAALAQGGGAGILGDYLFGQYSREGESLSETMLGPVLGSAANSVFDIYNRVKQKAEHPYQPGPDIKAELFRLVTKNTPFVNLAYTQLALNYLVLWQIQEALNPGFMQRYQQRVEQEQHSTFWLSPSRAVAP